MTEHRIVSLHAGYNRSDGSFVEAYLGRPAEGAQWPGIVLLSGMHGVNWFQRQITKRFAQAGFVALSPDSIEGAHPEDRTSALLVKNSVDLEAAVDTAVQGAAFLRNLPWTNVQGRIGVVGFCLGGGLALLALARTDAFGAGVIYYHSLFPDPRELQHIRAPLLCHYGTADETTPREEVEAFREALQRYEKEFEIRYYDDMPHSFLNTGQNPSPGREQAVETSLSLTFQFLGERLATTS